MLNPIELPVFMHLANKHNLTGDQLTELAELFESEILVDDEQMHLDHIVEQMEYDPNYDHGRTCINGSWFLEPCADNKIKEYIL